MRERGRGETEGKDGVSPGGQGVLSMSQGCAWCLPGTVPAVVGHEVRGHQAGGPGAWRMGCGQAQRQAGLDTETGIVG